MSNDCQSCLRWEPEESSKVGRCSLLFINTKPTMTCIKWQQKFLCLLAVGVGGTDHRRHCGNPEVIGETLCGLKYKINRPYGSTTCPKCQQLAATYRKG